jgi:hypothetical protein
MALLRVIAAVAIPLALPGISASARDSCRASPLLEIGTGPGLFFGRDGKVLAPNSSRAGIGPWDDFVGEAAARFGVPVPWIMSVMRAESDGRAFIGGTPVTSRAGAIGLMQVMPETYSELQQRYGLGDDPADPRDNILAGTAYLRELYDRFGAPDFLAAYNAGPARLQAYRDGARALPDETSRYLEKIGPDVTSTAPPGATAELTALHDSAALLDGGPLFFTLKQRPTPPLASP